MIRAERELRKQLEQYVHENEIAGASLLVKLGTNTLCHFHCGYANVETQEELSDHSIFRLASMTKPVMAIAAMILQEREQLSLEQTISEFLPEFQQAKTATIRDILTHSSGLGQGIKNEEILQSCFHIKDTLQDRIAKFAQLPLDFEPGTATGYSGLVAFDILGRIFEIVSGMDLETLLRQLIFEPLDIQQIGFQLSSEQRTRLVTLYHAENGQLSDVSETDELYQKINPLLNGYMSGSAGLFGTLNDYAKIVQLLAEDGTFHDIQLLKQETVLQMRSAASRHKKERHPGIVWGLGMSVTYDPVRANLPHSPGTFGWSGAFGTHFLIDPVKNMHMVLMLNRSNIGGASSYISKQVEDLIYEWI